MGAYVFEIYDATTGAPLAGQSPAWATYVRAATGAADTGPGINDLGGGQYETDVDPAYTGLISLGGSSSRPYEFVPPAAEIVFAAFDGAGAPVPGLALNSGSWTVYQYATGGAISPGGTSFADLGGGLYRADGVGFDAVGIVDLGAAQSPRYLSITGTFGGPGGLAIGNPLPLPDSGPITPATPLSVDITTPGEVTVGLLVFTFPNTPQPEIVLLPGPAFSPLYRDGSAFEPIAGGLRIRLVRANGWRGSPTLLAQAGDDLGNEAEASFTWTLAPDVSVAASSTVAARTAAAPYGRDISTYVDAGFGPGLDPLFRIISDPRRVLAEAVLRLWSTPRGSYPGDASIGWDARQLINARQTPSTLLAAQMAMGQAATVDERLQNVGVTLALIGATGGLLATALITPAPATGVRPFQLIASVTVLSVDLVTLQ